jgi:hypothetical protein
MTKPFKSQLDLLARQIAEQMQPFADMQKRIAKAMAPTLTALDCLAKQLEPVSKHFDRIAASMAPVAMAIALTGWPNLFKAWGYYRTHRYGRVLESDVTDVEQLRHR